jgi:hypothetical protein
MWECAVAPSIPVKRRPRRHVREKPRNRARNLVLLSSIVPRASLTPLGFQERGELGVCSGNSSSSGESLVVYRQQLGPGQADGHSGDLQRQTGHDHLHVLCPGRHHRALRDCRLPSANIVVSYQGVQSNAVVFQVKPANPAIFTRNSSGEGDALSSASRTLPYSGLSAGRAGRRADSVRSRQLSLVVTDTATAPHTLRGARCNPCGLHRP